MTYQALARKWRPRTFAELSGQEHVVRALTHALERGRLHHAYLLTGTRGVGKTTIARILAKSLNCVLGVTPTPCGVCAACVDVDSGRFVDLLELDAASNTGIDNMREILDNARYAPTVGRTKVYLIDEVHMLSKQAFNSMLKTLEEPPEHVKFVLATTDPQKIPVTVLSRCLQFNLKQLPKTVIAARLAEILGAESVAFEAPALDLIASAAKGSMRDALSVLDQAIAYGAGEVRETVIRTMLGVADVDYVYRIADAVLANDGAALLRDVEALGEGGLSAGAALDDLASLFHRIALVQAVPAAAEGMSDAQRVRDYAATLSPEMTQLAYQIVVQGRADLPLAPDEMTGLSMSLLRLLAFEPVLAPGLAPAAPTSGSPVALSSSQKMSSAGAPTRPVAVASAPADAAPSKVSEPPPARLAAVPSRSVAPASPPAIGSAAAVSEMRGPRSVLEPAPASAAMRPAGVPAEASSGSTSPAPLDEAAALPSTDGSGAALSVPEPEQWPTFIAGLKLSGIALQLAAQTELKSVQGNELLLHVSESGRHLVDKVYTDKLKAVLDQALGRRLRLRFEVATTATATLATQEKQQRAKAQADTDAAFQNDPFVQDVLARFDARIKPDSIKPV